MASESASQQKGDFNYLLVYLLEWLTGIIYFILKGGSNKRMKLHSLQAILLGVIAIVLSVLSFIPFVWVLSFLIWLYGMYIGYEASVGKDIAIPGITDFAKRYV